MQDSTCGDIPPSVLPPQWMKPDGWVIGIADTGRMFVLNKDTGTGGEGGISWDCPAGTCFDPHPESGYWLPGPSGIAVSPDDGLLYVAGTDYDRAWIGSQYDRGREKLFCYDYVTDPNTLIPKWEYQFCTNDDCSTEANEFIVGGHGPYVVAWYSVPSPALADGHVYYASTNGKIYCFGVISPQMILMGMARSDYGITARQLPNGPNGGTTGECGTGGFCTWLRKMQMVIWSGW